MSVVFDLSAASSILSSQMPGNPIPPAVALLNLRYVVHRDRSPHFLCPYKSLKSPNHSTLRFSASPKLQLSLNLRSTMRHDSLIQRTFAIPPFLEPPHWALSCKRKIFPLKHSLLGLPSLDWSTLIVVIASNLFTQTN